MPCAPVADKDKNAEQEVDERADVADRKEDVHKAKVENVRELIGQAFPVDAKAEEEIQIHHLWSDYYRLNFWSDEKSTFTRSHFVECCDEHVTLVHDDGREEPIL